MRCHSGSPPIAELLALWLCGPAVGRTRKPAPVFLAPHTQCWAQAPLSVALALLLSSPAPEMLALGPGQGFSSWTSAMSLDDRSPRSVSVSSRPGGGSPTSSVACDGFSPSAHALGCLWSAERGASGQPSRHLSLALSGSEKLRL